jgi:hypothetical protein
VNVDDPAAALVGEMAVIAGTGLPVWAAMIPANRRTATGKRKADFLQSGTSIDLRSD